MKLFLLAVCFLAIASFTVGFTSFEIRRTILLCMIENNCTEDLYKVMMKNEVPKTNQGLNSTYCAAKKIGMVNKDNKINSEVMTTVLKIMHFSSEVASKITTECESKYTGTTPIQAMKSLMICIQSTAERKN